MQVLTNAGGLDRDKQLAVVEQLMALVVDASGDPATAQRTWVLLTEAADGGWGLKGHAHTNEELVAAAAAFTCLRSHGGWHSVEPDGGDQFHQVRDVAQVQPGLGRHPLDPVVRGIHMDM